MFSKIFLGFFGIVACAVLNASPIFQVMLAYQNIPVTESGLSAQSLGDITLEPYDLELDSAKFEQTLTLWPENNRLCGALTYNTDLFNHKTIESFSQDYVLLLENICKNIDLPVKALTNLVSEASLERARLSKLNFRSQRTRKRVRKTETKTV